LASRSERSGAESGDLAIQDLLGFPPIEQETTLMCISNGLDAGLISNAVWKGLPLRDLLDQATPFSSAARVRFHGVDNYTDTIALEKAMDPTTLLAYEMNGVRLPDRHGYPLRVIVPGYFGEKHVKWLTRIELTDPNAKGFYETQGWGLDFITPTRSRIDVPDHESWFLLGQLNGPIEVKGISTVATAAFHADEFDDGKHGTMQRLPHRRRSGVVACTYRLTPTGPGDMSSPFALPTARVTARMERIAVHFPADRFS
jgi:hypothetical protein